MIRQMGVAFTLREQGGFLMILSLSGRIAELENSADQPPLSFGDFAELAAEVGFRALDLRPWQVPMKAADEEVKMARLSLSMRACGHLW